MPVLDAVVRGMPNVPPFPLFHVKNSDPNAVRVWHIMHLSFSVSSKHRNNVCEDIDVNGTDTIMETAEAPNRRKTLDIQVSGYLSGYFISL